MIEMRISLPAGSSTSTTPTSQPRGSDTDYCYSGRTYSSPAQRQTSSSTTSYYIPLSTNPNNYDQDDEFDDTTDFAFDFTGYLNATPSLYAEELFHGGKIKPFMEPPPPSPHSPACNTPVDIGNEERTREIRRDNTLLVGEHSDADQRGRKRVYEPSSTRRRQKFLSKSLSPLRNSNMVSERISHAQASKQTVAAASCYGNWKLTNLLLFRSSSEGHATTNKRNDFVRKTSHEDYVKKSSFRSISSNGLASSGQRPGKWSPHEWHYMVNRSVAEDMRKKSFLPYKKHIINGLHGY